MALSASMKTLLVLCLLAAVGGEGAAQEPDFLPLQPDKLEWAQQVARHAKVRKDSNLLAESHYLFGKTYEAAGNFLEAKRHFFQSLRIQEARGYAYAQVRLYRHLATVETNQLHYGEAMRYARIGLRIAEQSKDDKALNMAYGKMFEVYSDLSGLERTNITANVPKPSYDSLLHYLRKQEPIARRIGKPFDIMVLDSRLGGEMLRRKDRRAIAYAKKALERSIELKKPFEQVTMMLTLASAYLVFEQPKEAFGYLQRAKKLHDTISTNTRNFGPHFESTYAQYYKAVGNWKAALEHTEKLHELKQKDYLADHQGAVTRLGIEFENEKKEAQLASQQKELALKSENLRAQQGLLLSVSLLLLLSVGGIAFYYRLYRQKEHLSRHNAELVQEQNHRVKNNLQVVSSLLQLQANRLTDATAIRAVEDAQARIEVMALLQRKLYDTDQVTSMKVQGFIRNLVSTSLEAFDLTTVATHYAVPDTLELSPDHTLRIGLIVNELVTNACKYAFANHPAPALWVKAWMEGSDFHLVVADNGPGFGQPRATPEKRQSLGMKIIQLQVDQLYGDYRFETTAGTEFRMHFKVTTPQFTHRFTHPPRLAHDTA
mgnify:CR=1 FL=1